MIAFVIIILDICKIRSHNYLFAGIDGSLVSSWHEVNYTKSFGKKCIGKSAIADWPNMNQAIINCNCNNDCVGVYDKSCDGNEFSTCKKFEKSTNLNDGCYYNKNGVDTKIVTFDLGM